MDRLNHLLGLVETRQWEKAWEEFQRLMTEGPQPPRLLLLGSHVAFGQRDLFRARHLAEAALAAWGESDLPVLLGKIRFHLGMVAREIGDAHTALEQFKLFLGELPVRYPELVMGEGKAYFYLGLTYRQQRDYEASLAAYQSAMACFRRDGLPSLLCKTLQNTAWLFCQMNRPLDARECLEESGKLATNPEDEIHQKLGEALLAVLQGNSLLAADLCESIFRRAERGEAVSSEERAEAALVAAKAAANQGRMETAAALAEIALGYAAEARDSRLINDAGALRRTLVQPEGA